MKKLGFLFLISGILFLVLGLRMPEKVSISFVHGKEKIIMAKYKSIIVNFSFIGDSLLASFKGEKYSENFQDLLEKHDYSFPYKYVKHIFENDDFTIANGENVFTDRLLSPIQKNHSPAYWYYTNSKYANIYQVSSIEVVSLMNNHSYDYGQIGYQDTIKALQNANVKVGLEEPLILEKEGIKIAIICTNLFHAFQANLVNQKINNIKEEVNYIIVYFHGGEEYKYKPDEEIVNYAHQFIDNGADLIVGAHPHVLQPMEIYKDKIIVYSLGSFLFGGTTTLSNRTLIYQISLEFDKDKKIINKVSNFIPCYLYKTKTGYEKWLPSIISDETEKKKVIDFMHNLRSVPY